jgi:class 3 adenylate cyclase
MDPMRSLIDTRWNLRRSRIARLGWWLGFLCLAILTLFPRGAGWILFAAWVAANLLLALVAGVWGLFHPRSILRARHAALQWAFWLTLLAALALYAGLETFRAAVEPIGFGPYASSGLNVLIVLVFSPVLFLVLLLAGLFGACVGAFTGRRRADAATAARLGAGAYWIAALGAVFVALLTRLVDAPPSAVAGLIAGIPAATSVTSLLAVNSAAPQQLARRALSWTERHLVWRTGWRRIGIIDTRGVVLGIVGGVVALVTASTLLSPLKAEVLASLIEFRHNLVRAGGMADLDSDMPGSTRAARRGTRGRLVLLDMDSLARREALVTRSEAAIQAEMIRRLGAYGATRIVLPLPVLDPSWAERPARGQETPAPTPESVGKSVADLPALEAAMRAAKCVVLAVPRFQGRMRLAPAAGSSFADDLVRLRPAPGPLRDAIKRLGAAASAIGAADLGSYGSARLPVIPTRSSDYLPVPILLDAAILGRPPTVRLVPDHPYLLEIAGQRVPEIAPSQVLVGFSAYEPGRAFPQLTYSAARNDLPVYGVPADESPGGAAGAGRWLPPREYFRSRVVFLDSLEPRTRDTPIGTLPRTEALAHATATLVSGPLFARPDPFWAVLWTLLLGALVGHLCRGHDPIEASWRVAIPAFLVIGLAIVEFFDDQWIDPVAPLATILCGFLLVTQFTFALERTERYQMRRLLERFVAPEVVEPLLQDYIRDPDSLGLGGRREKVCVLFADLRGFTQFAEQHTPEQVIEVINVYMTALTEAVFSYGGILDKYTGDGLMAIFRVSEPSGDAVSRAVRAALAMRDAAEQISARLATQGRHPMRVGIGLHCGEAIVGLVGNPNHFNFTALGHTVVVSHRLQSIAAGGDVVISETVYLETSGAFPVEQGEPVRVKGISEPIRPYRIPPVSQPQADPEALTS